MALVYEGVWNGVAMRLEAGHGAPCPYQRPALEPE